MDGEKKESKIEWNAKTQSIKRRWWNWTREYRKQTTINHYKTFNHRHCEVAPCKKRNEELDWKHLDVYPAIYSIKCSRMNSKEQRWEEKKSKMIDKNVSWQHCLSLENIKTNQVRYTWKECVYILPNNTSFVRLSYIIVRSTLMKNSNLNNS